MLDMCDYKVNYNLSRRISEGNVIKLPADIYFLLVPFHSSAFFLFVFQTLGVETFPICRPERENVYLD